MNRVYPSREAYLNTLYDVIFGYIDPGRFDDDGKECHCAADDQWYRSVYQGLYVPARVRKIRCLTISEQLGAYREIKERVEDLEHRIEILSEIRAHNLELLQVKTDKIRTEQILRILIVSRTARACVWKRRSLIWRASVNGLRH